MTRVINDATEAVQNINSTQTKIIDNTTNLVDQVDTYSTLLAVLPSLQNMINQKLDYLNSLAQSIQTSIAQVLEKEEPNVDTKKILDEITQKLKAQHKVVTDAIKTTQETLIQINQLSNNEQVSVDMKIQTASV